MSLLANQFGRRRKRFCAVLTVFLLLAACSGGQADVSADDDLSAVGAYIAASTSGDLDAVVSSFTSSAVISTGFGDDVSPTDWERIAAFGVGERTIWTSPDCEVVEGATDSTKTVS